MKSVLPLMFLGTVALSAGGGVWWAYGVGTSVQATAAASALAAPSGCPKFTTHDLGRVNAPELREASGIVASRRNPGLLWVHNDGGHGLLYAIDEHAQLVETFRLTGVQMTDWEDIAVGPGPDAGVAYLYVGDIGDNNDDRVSAAVYRVPEPVVTPSLASVTTSLPGAVALPFTYADKAHNAETLLLDPATADLYVVTKRGKHPSGVYADPAPQSTTTMDLAEVDELAFGTGMLAGSNRATGGDISPDGQSILLRTYSNAFLWKRAGRSVAATLAGDPCPVALAQEPQGEGIGFSADGKSYFSISEGISPTLYRYDPVP